jgi:integrase
LSAVRPFAAHLHAMDPAHQIPPPGLLGPARSRATPYLYTDTRIEALIDAAARLPHPLNAATYQTLLGLPAVTGLRRGEAIALDASDLDDQRGVLTIRDAKFGKSRLLPLHPSTTDALVAYLGRSRRLRPGAPADGPLLISTRGTRLHHVTVSGTFHRLVLRAGLRPRSASCRPRMLSRHGARCRDCSWPVSPCRSPNPPYRSLGNGLSTVSAGQAGLGMGHGVGILLPR